MIRRLLAKLTGRRSERIDLSDPDQRAGVSLHFILDQQISLLNMEYGKVPFDDVFASDKCRGALLGTAIAVVVQQHGKAEHKAVIDASIAAFSIVFGPDIGRRAALQTIADAAHDNDDINNASDWAIKDTRAAEAPGSVASPIAYYAAVTGVI